MRRFKLNGKEYNAKAFDFNTVCDLEDFGFSMSDIEGKPMSMVRAYLALCLGKSVQEAGNEMEMHIVNGGNFDTIMDVITKEMNESGFFRNLNKRAEEETTEVSEEPAEK